MNDQARHPARGLVDPHGRPIATRRVVVDRSCPGCRAGPANRQKSGGFGVPHPVCGLCGYEWHDEVWRD